MDTFLRPPILVCRNIYRLHICSRQFRTRAGRQSIGLGASRNEQLDGNFLGEDQKYGKLFQDHNMQKLWNNTFERIALVLKANQGAPTVTSSDKSDGLGGLSSILRRSHHNDPTIASTDRGTLSGVSNSKDHTSGFKTANSNLFSLEDQQMMKLSFAEGYFYGQRTIKKSKLSYLRNVTIIVTLVIAIYYMTPESRGIRRSILGLQSFEIQPEEIDVSFADVKGCDEAKQELADVVEYLKNPTKYSRLGAKLPKGALLYGPPGTGKTLLARAVAGEAGVPFFSASGSEFEEVLVGQGARRVRDLFERAKKKAPCVIFIDEIDSVGAKRTSTLLHPYANQTINQLLSEMDGFSPSEGVIVMGATNRPGDLDKALLRPGRFDVRITVAVPDSNGRRELFAHYISKIKASSDIDLDALCQTTIGLTGADIESLVNQAALKAAADNMEFVTQEVLEFAREKIITGPARTSRVRHHDDILQTAYHECGHALVAHLNDKADLVHVVTITARGNSLGHTQLRPEREYLSLSREQLAASIDVILGGRIAEELIYGPDKVKNGCSDDLVRANHLAGLMVREFGMSEKVGLRVVKENSGRAGIVVNTFSDATSELVESEIARILDESTDRVKKLLAKHENDLKLLTEALMKYETLDGDEVKLVLEGKDPKILRQEREMARRIKRSNLKLSQPTDGLPLNLLK